jgi:GNAT superfamily N-acetyltransferase
MNVAARPAVVGDLPELERLYRLLEEEMVALHKMWPLADGFDEPVSEGFRTAIDDEQSVVLIGTIDDVPFGFIFGRSEPMLTQAGDRRVAAIRMVFTEHAAREVGIGEVMRDTLVDMFRETGHRLFDAHVLPGHRLAKNFFESGGFSARSIIMHHDDDRER